jgi:hypothetical protein
VDAAQIKRCPYCLHQHENKGRACSEECEAKLRSRRASGTRRRRKAVNAILEAEQDKHRHDRRWRDVAFGRNEAGQLSVIFGLSLPLGMSRR